MGERIDMSLDEIIRRKGKGKPVQKRGIVTRKNRNQPKIGKSFDLNQKLKRRQNISGDARLKIMNRQRAKFKDARDNLNQMNKFTDARQKLIKMKQQKQGPKTVDFRRVGNNIASIKALQSRTMGQIRQQLMNSQITNMPFNNRSVPTALTRTITHQGNSVFGSFGPGFEPSDETSVMRGKHVILGDRGMLITTRNEPSLLQQQQHQLQPQLYQHHVMDEDDIEMSEAPPVITQRNRLSASLQSRLDNRQTSNEQRGCKVIVSNLQSSVSQDDILELFADIGSLRRATLGKSGTAEVVFVRAVDAQKACNAYHNRQLDGRPMSVKIAPSIADIKGPRISPDAEIIRKALFSKNYSTPSSSMMRNN